MDVADFIQNFRSDISITMIMITIVMMSANITVNDLNIFGTLKVKKLKFICKSIFNGNSKKISKKSNVK